MSDGCGLTAKGACLKLKAGGAGLKFNVGLVGVQIVCL